MVTINDNVVEVLRCEKHLFSLVFVVDEAAMDVLRNFLPFFFRAQMGDEELRMGKRNLNDSGEALKGDEKEHSK